MEQDYLIAGHRIKVENETLMHAMDRMSGFEVFKVNNKDEDTFRFVLVDSEMPAWKEILYSIDINGTINRFGTCTNGYIFESTPPEGETLELWVDNNGHTAHLKGNLDPRLLRFACWMAYGVMTVPYQTVAIHTSTIVCRGKAVLFLGESGTGKSTHTRLWRENIEEATLVNDDSPIVRITDGQPWVWGSPWSGKTPCYKKECYPLAACVRLSQAPFNKIRRLAVAEAYASLHPSCPPAFSYDESLYDSICEVLNAILTNVPVYHLACLPDADAARLSYETIFGTCEK